MQLELNAPISETLMKKILCFSLFALAAALVITSGQTAPPSAEAHRIYIEDQKDRGVGSEHSLPSEQLEARDALRRARIHELLAAGSLETAEDFHDAAFIYQHGQTSADYLLAHVLATTAVSKGDARSLWISSATLDRYLNSIGQPQIFGTQYHSKNDDPYTQEPYDRLLIPDQLRLIFCVPGTDQQRKNLAEFNGGKYPAGIIPQGCNR
jgi:hypothetical protein